MNQIGEMEFPKDSSNQRNSHSHEFISSAGLAVEQLAINGRLCWNLFLHKLHPTKLTPEEASSLGEWSTIQTDVCCLTPIFSWAAECFTSVDADNLSVATGNPVFIASPRVSWLFSYLLNLIQLPEFSKFCALFPAWKDGLMMLQRRLGSSGWFFSFRTWTEDATKNLRGGPKG